MKRVLFIDNAHPLLRQKLEAAGFHCDEFPDIKNNDYLKIIENYNGVIIRSKIPVDRDFIDSAVNLEFIGRVGSGMENIDLDYAHIKGIQCFNSPEGNRDAVAEHAIGMLLTLMNKLLIADSQVRKGIWSREENRGIELLGKTIALIGFGNVGSTMAQKLSGFGCRILAYDKYKHGFGNHQVEESDMKSIFLNADILSLHVPLTKETTYLVNDSYLNQFKKKIWLINTSRGPIVNTKSLVNALISGKVSGAALDVFEFEESSFNMLTSGMHSPAMQFLAQTENVILSPHIAGWTEESKIKLAEILADKIINALKCSGRSS